MRLRNVKGASKLIEESDYVIKDYNEYRGKYNNLFNNDNPIHLEIGMGKGSFIINMAKKYPNINFIGIEKFDSVLVRALEKIDDDIPNLKLIRMDAKDICDVFSREISCIYLNFSDPWPKNRHENRRLTSKEFLRKYDLIFKNSNNIVMKTDNRKLFEYSLISFNEYGYIVKEISLDLYKDEIKNNIPTEYEIKFNNLGMPIYRVVVEK